MSNNDFKLQTPVLFLVFNRLDTTKQVFEAIRQAQPPRLYVAADGARESREGEADKVQAVRDYIVNNIDWDCEVKTLFRDKNLGCRIAVSGAIDWFFENEEQGIILEDDCLPNLTFFRFCEELLEHYKKDQRIMMISGTNSVGTWKNDIQSYHYSIYGSIWGWATWKRAWEYYDQKMSLWQDLDIQERLADVITNRHQFKARKIICDKSYRGLIDSWGYVWTFSRLIQSGLAIVPSVNLIQNLGFQAETATHTKSSDQRADNMRNKMLFPIKINHFVAVDRRYDYLLHTVNNSSSFLRKLSNKLLNIFNI